MPDRAFGQAPDRAVMGSVQIAIIAAGYPRWKSRYGTPSFTIPYDVKIKDDKLYVQKLAGWRYAGRAATPTLMVSRFRFWPWSKRMAPSSGTSSA